MNAQDLVFDLSLKYPKGPSGNLRKKHYSTTHDWCDFYQRFRESSYVFGDRNGRWGTYSPETVWRVLGKELDHSRISSILRDAYGEREIHWSPRSLSLRTRRVMQKLSLVNDHLRKNGDAGIWKATWGWQSSIRLWAESSKDAQARATLFAGLFNKDLNDTPSVHFEDYGTPLEAFQLNKQALDSEKKRIQSEIDRLEASLAHARSKSQEQSQKESILLDMLSDQIGEESA